MLLDRARDDAAAKQAELDKLRAEQQEALDAAEAKSAQAVRMLVDEKVDANAELDAARVKVRQLTDDLAAMKAAEAGKLKAAEGRGAERKAAELGVRLDAKDAEIRTLIGRMARKNPTWEAPRIHGELLKLGFEVAEATVSRTMPRRRKPPSQTWREFLRNHTEDLVSIDFFVVPTATFRVLYVFLVLEHERRRIVHFNVTEGPSAQWTGQQLVIALPMVGGLHHRYTRRAA